MAKPRKQLHEELCTILGSRNCYWSPPATSRMEYPCIRYVCEGEDVWYADDRPYKSKRRYLITYISEKTDEWEMVEKLKSAFLHCRFDRRYAVNNLNHYTFTLYY